MTPGDVLLDVRGLRAAYGSAQVLHGVDLQVRGGEVVALLGRNGMGKTTLVRAVMGIVAASAGELRFDGESMPVSRRTASPAAASRWCPRGARSSRT